ncbi:hypothetical protein ACHWP0_07725 [Weissella cibaria]|uniref:hypothetical protein n=1 Tax=Weissella cibaria TaxID=137591 RepID=UPI00376EAB8A
MFFILNPIGYTVGLLIGILLRPLIWVARLLLRFIGFIVKRTISLLFQALLFVAIFAIAVSQNFYRNLANKYPIVDEALPSVVLGSVLFTLFAVIVMH